jgi:acetate---CoA ligase (ADP-forming)
VPSRPVDVGPQTTPANTYDEPSVTGNDASEVSHSPEPSSYPTHREADVALRDGSTIHVRPVRPDDKFAVLSLLKGLSDQSRYLRFFSGAADLERAAQLAVDLDYRSRYGLVATSGETPVLVAHATYVQSRLDRAEIAFAIAEPFQGRGLGTLLLAHLAQAAQENGINVFEARVLPENHRMIEVFRESGFPVATQSEPGEIFVEFPTALTAQALDRFERREQTAAVAAIHEFLYPSSVAVIGASRTRATIGGEVFHNLLATPGSTDQPIR